MIFHWFNRKNNCISLKSSHFYKVDQIESARNCIDFLLYKEVIVSIFISLVSLSGGLEVPLESFAIKAFLQNFN